MRLSALRGAFERRSNQVANFLAAQGVEPSVRVTFIMLGNVPGALGSHAGDHPS